MAQGSGDDAGQRVLRATGSKAHGPRMGFRLRFESDAGRFGGLETNLSDDPTTPRPSHGDACSAVSSWSQKELQKLQKRDMELACPIAVAHLEMAQSWDKARSARWTHPDYGR